MNTLRIKKLILSVTLAIVIGVFLSLGIAHAENAKRHIASATKNNTIEFTVQFPEPTITEVDGYHHIEMEGVSSLGNTGEPILPVKGINVLIPLGKDIKDSEVILGEKVTLPGTYKVEPAQQPVPLSYEGKVEKTLPKQEIYESKNPYPKEKREKIISQKMRGYRIEVFKLSPIEYIPKEGIISYYKSMTLRVSLTPQPKKVKAAKELKKEPRLRRLHKDKERLKRFIANTQDIPSYDTAIEETEPLGNEAPQDGPEPLSEGGGSLSVVTPGDYKYVVITNENLKNAPGPYNFQALCEEKEARGITTNIVTTEWIYANYDGTRPDGQTDNATKIRNFIIDAYNNWETEYILLGGDATGNPSNTEIIPCRELFDEPWPNAAEKDQLPSDIYYCCLDGNMDYDADGVYGEKRDGINGGEIDLIAEVFIGRAPIVTQVELSNFVGKTLTYNGTSSSYISNTYMLGEYLGFGGVAEYATESMEEIRLGSETHGYRTAGFATLQHLELNTLYDTPGYGWPKTDIITIINNGVHIINHLGHANVTYNMKMYNNDADALTNTKYFFGYSQGCLPGAFEQDCIVEHFVKNSTGAFAFVGNSRYGWGMYNSTAGPSQYFNRQFWDAVFGETIFNLGKANQDSKENNLWCIDYECHRWCYLELNLFGDPELSLKFISSDGIIFLDNDCYTPSSYALISLVDTDINTNPSLPDTVNVQATSGAEDIPEMILLTETGSNTSVFVSSINFQLGTAQPDGILQVNESDLIRITYNEEVPLGIKTASAIIDGIEPVITSPPMASPYIRLDGSAGVEIYWQTDEPSTSTIYYGISSPLNEVFSLLNFIQEHSINIKDLGLNTIYYFAVESKDELGNVVHDDNGGNFYQFVIVPPCINVTPLDIYLNAREGAMSFTTVINIANSGSAGCIDLCFEIPKPSQTWLSITKLDGNIPSSSSIEIPITIDPSYLGPGVYTSEIIINNNASPHYPISIPLVLNVDAAPAARYWKYNIIDNWSGNSYMCNGDKRLNPGETVELQIGAMNIGSLPAENVTATLALVEADPYIQIVDGAATFPDIAAGGHALTSENFLIKALDNTPDRHTANFRVEIIDVNNYIWVREFSITVTTPFIGSVVDPIRLDGDLAGADSIHPKISTDGYGSLCVVWEAKCGMAWDVYRKYSNDYGATWEGDGRKLNTDSPTPGMKEPFICNDEDGRMYVVWISHQDPRQSYDGEPETDTDSPLAYYWPTNVYFNSSSNYGADWQPSDKKLNKDTFNDWVRLSPSISADNSGHVYVVWPDTRYAGYPSSHNIYSDFSHDYGATWQLNDKRIDHDINNRRDAWYCDICSDEEGHVYALWAETYFWGEDPNESHVYFNYSYDFALTWQTTDIKVNKTTMGNTYRTDSPQIGCDNYGHVYAAWWSSFNGVSSVYFNCSTDYGVIWQESEIRLDSGIPSSKSVKMCCDNNGNVYIVWRDTRNGNGDVYFNCSHDFGANWRPTPIRLDTNPAGTADSDSPDICCDENGCVYVIWRDKRSGDWGLHINYSSDFGDTWQTNDINLAAKCDSSDIRCDNSGTAFITWAASGLDLRDVYFRTFSALSQHPALEPVLDQTVEEKQPLNFDIMATSSDGTELELFMDTQGLSQDLRDNISNATFTTSFNEETGETIGTFTWTPPSGTTGDYYPVIFVARDPLSGRCAYQAITITVLPPPPIADFTASVTEGVAPLTVSFTDTSTGDITSWSWDFGDGGTSTEQNPSHTYNTPGTYTVSLTVQGPGGSDTETKENYISVTLNNPPALDPIPDVSVTEGASVSFFVHALDPDYEQLTLTCNPLPEGATFINANDVNHDGVVNQADRDLVDQYWHQGIYVLDADVNRDGVIDVTDRAIVNAGVVIGLANWLFEWVPTFEQGGVYNVTFIVSDGELSASETITITVAHLVEDINELQQAIYGASSGDTIILEPGIYSLDDLGSRLEITKNLTIKGLEPLNTIIELGDYHIFIKDPRFYSQSEYYNQLFKNLNDVTIEGITIKGYTGTSTEGAIQNYSGKLTLRNCRIIDNEGIKVSAIYSCWNSELYLENTLIARNRNLPATSVSPYIGRYGSNVYCGTIYLSGFLKLYAVNSTIADNINDSQPFTIQTGYGQLPITVKYGAIYRDCQNYLTMNNSIMWGNGDGASVQDFSRRDQKEKDVIITYCDLESTDIYMNYASYITNIYENVIHKDPEFVDEVNYDYNISGTSPCKGTGEDGSDMGAKFE